MFIWVYHNFQKNKIHSINTIKNAKDCFTYWKINPIILKVMDKRNFHSSYILKGTYIQFLTCQFRYDFSVIISYMIVFYN